MCGISGIISDKTIERSVIEEMTGCLAHRGPDSSGIYLDESDRIALGHRRLSIIDLSSAAGQPFHSANNRFVVVFNGEIYNYKILRKELQTKHSIHFKTNSDTEIIAEGFAVWGNNLIEKLDGMFAIAVLDKTLRKIFLIRDRIGKKPLYYFKSGHYLAFASEIKALLKDPRIAQQLHINPVAISNFLHLGYIPEPHTIYNSIFKFPAGSYAEVSQTEFVLHTYWKIDDQLKPKQNLSVGAAKDHLRELLDDSVKKRLLSDVPLGTFLSGGTDSSIVTAFALKHAIKKLQTFSIGFKESKYNETQYAREVALHLGTNHQEYLLSEKDAVDLLEKYTDHFDEPFADTSAIPTMMVSSLARKQVKVILTGDGGDELFQGYGSYRWANRLQKPHWKLMKSLTYSGLTSLGTSRLKRVGQLLTPIRIGESRSHIFSQEQYFFSQDEIRNKLLVNSELYSVFHYNETFLKQWNFSEAEKQALFDFKYYMKDDLLVKVDRASMYYGLECRCPLLDHNIVEFAFSLPDQFKVKNGVSKWLLKKVLSEFLPEKLVHRPKWGFSVPLAKWLKGDLRYLLTEYLSSPGVEQIGIVDAVYVQKLVNNFLNGHDYLYNRLWLLIVLHKSWREKNYQV
jgi:asparagine synthase (glutamine-hydrolysing)